MNVADREFVDTDERARMSEIRNRTFHHQDRTKRLRRHPDTHRGGIRARAAAARLLRKGAGPTRTPRERYTNCCQATTSSSVSPGSKPKACSHTETSAPGNIDHMCSDPALDLSIDLSDSASAGNVLPTPTKGWGKVAAQPSPPPAA
jgi:hypothetical protein